MTEQADIWKVFWKRYQDRYPFAFVFENLTKYLVSPEVMKTIEANVVESAKEAIKKEIMEPREILISVADCPKCKHPNDPSAKFCNQYGTGIKSN